MIIFVDKFVECLIPFTSFIILFVMDTILGICKGIKNKEFSSGKLRLSIPKFLAYIFVMFSCMILDILLMYGTDIEFFNEFSPIAVTSCILFSIIEIISILENFEEITGKLPKFLKNILKFFRGEIYEN